MNEQKTSSDLNEQGWKFLTNFQLLIPPSSEINKLLINFCVGEPKT